MELVKLIVLVVLVAQCHGQPSSVGSGDITSAPAPSPSQSPAPSSSTSPAPSSSTSPAPSSSTSPAPSSSTSPAPSSSTSPAPSSSPIPDPEPPIPDILEVNVTRAYRFNDPMDNTSFYQSVYGSIYENSSPFRYAHYNCHERDGSGIILNRVPSRYVLTIFLQMPVLHFLNVPYKIELMESIRTMLNINSTENRTSAYNPEMDRNKWFMDPPEICIDGYDQAFVGSYDEGIMLRVYERTYQSTGEELRQAFIRNRQRVDESFGSPSRTPVTEFGGEDAVFYNGPDGRAAVNIEEAIWVGRTSINLGGCRQLSTVYNQFNRMALNDSDLYCRSLDTDEQDDIRAELAVNPNPINYYLEAGDYVFAILGGVAVAIVLGLATLGYCIHPFFLA